MLALPVKDRKVVEDAVARAYRADDRVKKHLFKDHYTIWEMGVQKQGSDEAKGSMDIPYHVTAVGQDCLFVSNNRELLTAALGCEQGKENPHHLACHNEYQCFLKEAARLGADKVVGQQFTNLANDLRGLYQITRANNLADVDSLYAQLIVQLIDSGKFKLKGELLPDYSQVKHHLGSVGSFFRIAPDGWDLIGFCPRKDK